MGIQQAIEKTIWDEYAQLYRQFTPSFQKVLLEDVASRAKGLVIDAGTGVGKTLPYLAANSDVRRIFAFDRDGAMLREAEESLRTASPRTRRLTDVFQHDVMKIDELTQYQPDSICSVNVIYSLDNPIQFIKKSYETLAHGGRLILSSQNRGVDLSLLKQDMDFEFSGLPGYHRFLEINQHLVGQSGGRPRTYNLDEMADICSMAGFSVRNVDDTHYHGCNFTLSAEKHG